MRPKLFSQKNETFMKKSYLTLLIGITIASCHESPKEKVTVAAGNVSRTIVSEEKITVPGKFNAGKAFDASAALNFANDYVDNIYKLNSINEIEEWVAASPYVTAHYKETIKQDINEINHDPETILDADIIFDAQDYPDEGFELESADEKTSHAVLRGKRWKDFKFNVKLAKENGKWLVDDSGNL